MIFLYKFPIVLSFTRVHFAENDNFYVLSESTSGNVDPDPGSKKKL